MINFDVVVKENIKDHNSNWPQIPDHPYRIIIIGGSGSGKTNSLFNLTNQKPDIDKIYLHAKDPYEAKYQFLIKNHEDAGTKHINDSQAFIEKLLMIKFLLNTRIIWMIFIKILKIIMQIKNKKY